MNQSSISQAASISGSQPALQKKWDNANIECIAYSKDGFFWKLLLQLILVQVFIESLSVKRITEVWKPLIWGILESLSTLEQVWWYIEGKVLIIIFNIDFYILLLDIRKFRNGNRSFLELIYCIKWKEGLGL